MSPAFSHEMFWPREWNRMLSLAMIIKTKVFHWWDCRWWISAWHQNWNGPVSYNDTSTYKKLFQTVLKIFSENENPRWLPGWPYWISDQLKNQTWSVSNLIHLHTENQGKVLAENKPPQKERIFVEIALLTFDLWVKSKVIAPNERL